MSMLPLWVWVTASFGAGLLAYALFQGLRSRRQVIGHLLLATGWLSVVVGAPLLAYALFASFAVVDRTALEQLDPVVFVVLHTALIAPIAGALLWFSRRGLSYAQAQRAAVGGLLLGVGLVGAALALRTLGPLRSILFLSFDGAMASLWSLLAVKKARPLASVCAGVLALCGVGVFVVMAPGQWQAEAIACGAGLLLCLYRHQMGDASREYLWGFVGVSLVTMATVVLLIGLCFGVWSSLSLLSPETFSSVALAALGTLLVPILLLARFQRYHRASTLTLLALSGPLAGFAFAQAHEAPPFPLVGWLAAGLLVVSMVIRARSLALLPEQAVVHETQTLPSLPDEECETECAASEERTASFLSLLDQLSSSGKLNGAEIPEVAAVDTQEERHTGGLNGRDVEEALARADPQPQGVEGVSCVPA